MLAITFACKKFHHYIYGRLIKVLTDHKPLVSLVKKDIGKIDSPRLQRMRLETLKYKLEVSYIPGKEMLISDLLSRSHADRCEEEELGLNEMVHTINISDVKQKEFVRETEKD